MDEQHGDHRSAYELDACEDCSVSLSFVVRWKYSLTSPCRKARVRNAECGSPPVYRLSSRRGMPLLLDQELSIFDVEQLDRFSLPILSSSFPSGTS